MNTVTYETYPDMFLDDNCTIENENYDNETRYFEIPEEWAKEWVVKNGFLSLNIFNSEYIWDHTWQMWEDAIKEGVLVSERIESFREFEAESASVFLSIKKLAENPDALENFESYLSKCFGQWLKKINGHPDVFAKELHEFAHMYDK